MRLKTLAVSVLILAVLAALAFYLRRPAAPLSADARIDQPLVARATVEKADRLRLTDQGKTVELARQPDGGWRVASFYDLPADFSKLTGFVGSLTDTKIQRLVTTSPERIARLEFKDTGIALLDATGKELWSVTLGKTPESGGGRFLRFDGEAKAYLANFSAWLDSESKNWANPELLNVKPDTVAKIEISFGEGGPVVVSRAKKEEAWSVEPMPANQKLKAEKISSLLGSIGNLRFSETNDPTDPGVAAAKANLRTFKLTTFDHKTVTIALGRKPEEKKLKPPAAVPESPRKDESAKEPEKTPGEAGKPADNKPAAPEYETVPAGPVFVFVDESDASAPINAFMARRAFQVADYTFTGLPQKPEDLFEAATPPAPKSEDKKAAPEPAKP